MYDCLNGLTVVDCLLTASRAKMSAVKSISRFRGQTNHHALYPQPEGQLGDCMIKHGRELADTSVYGKLISISTLSIYLER